MWLPVFLWLPGLWAGTGARPYGCGRWFLGRHKACPYGQGVRVLGCGHFSVGYGADPHVCRILPIQRPLQRIVQDVFPNAVQRGFIANDVFVVIALPDAAAERLPSALNDTACV